MICMSTSRVTPAIVNLPRVLRTKVAPGCARTALVSSYRMVGFAPALSASAISLSIFACSLLMDVTGMLTAASLGGAAFAHCSIGGAVTLPWIVVPSIFQACSVDVPSIRTNDPVEGVKRSAAATPARKMSRAIAVMMRFMVRLRSCGSAPPRRGRSDAREVWVSEGERDFGDEAVELRVAPRLNAVVDHVTLTEPAVLLG